MTEVAGALPQAAENADPFGAFADELIARIENAAAANDARSTTFSFGPLVVDFRVVGDRYRHRLTEAIEFAGVSERARTRAAWRLTAIDGAVSGLGIPPEWKFPITSPRHLERLHQSHDGQLTVRYNPPSLTWSVICSARRLAAIWTADAEQLPDWDDSAPCREMFHWMTLSTDCFLAHSAAIGIGNDGILLTGPGGSGKSTTAAAAAVSGLMTIGDDFVLIDPRSGHAHALYDTIKLDTRSSAWFAELAAHAVNPRRDPSAKSRVHLLRSRPSAFAHQLRIKAIVLPRTGGQTTTTIAPATVAEAMRALVPTTICLIRGGEIETIRKSAAFLRGLPAYRCNLGADPREAVATLSAFIRDLPA
jgi:hypothetical protein